MADQQQRGTRLALRGAQHVQDLGLDGDVEGRGRLIGDDHIRVVGDGHRDHGALPHPAGELVRESLRPGGRFGNAHEVEQVDGFRTGALAGDVAVGADGLGDLVADPVDRGEGGERVLEDHADTAPAYRGEHPVGGADEFGPALVRGSAPGEPDRSPYPRIGRQQPEHGQCGGGLARPRLPHQAEHFAAVQGEVDAPDGGRPVEVDGETGDVQHHGCLSVSRRTHRSVSSL